MIPLVCALVLLLSRDGLTLDDVVASVGSVEHDPGIPMPIALRPTMPGVLAASLSRYPDSGLPYTLTLAFETDSRPTVEALRLAVGRFSRVPSPRGMPARVQFIPNGAGPAWRVVVIAELAPHDGTLESAPVLEVTLRRDPLLPAP